MPATATDSFVHLPADSNQALGIAQYAIDFMSGILGPGPSDAVYRKTELFHTDSVFCGISALALGTNAPTLLREEALDYPVKQGESGAHAFGSRETVKTEKAIVANASAVREWDSNGTNFGFNAERNHTAGEFGHNDFYPVCVAACQELGLDGAAAVRAMVLHDEIRGRLAEVFSLKTYKIDHVVHGAIASAAVYGALHAHAGRPVTPDMIEGAIGMAVAHYIPWRAIRAGKQLSDSKGASAAISTEAAVLSMQRAMRGFVGPRDVFRNPEAIFRFFEPTTEGADRWTELAPAPFDLYLSHSGDDFAVMGMHFKLGLYEHQSAGALQGIINLVSDNPSILAGPEAIASITIDAYEPAFGIIGNPAKKDPRTRQSADHSMAYIVSTLVRKAMEHEGELDTSGGAHDAVWKSLMLEPHDYKVDESAIFHPVARDLMQKIDFRHGGPEYDAKYPDGIPTSLTVETSDGQSLESGLIMYPAGHARNTTANLENNLHHKFRLLGALAIETPGAAIEALSAIRSMDAESLRKVYAFDIIDRGRFE